MIATDYRGYTIHYSENADEWTCWDMGAKHESAPTLSKMKERIDRVLLEERKASAVLCWEINPTDGSAIEAKVIEYLGPVTDGGGWNRKPLHVSGHKVAVTERRRGNDRVSRQETGLSQLAPMSAEAEIEAAKAAYADLQKATAAFKAAMSAIPRLSVDDVAELVRISGIDPTAGIEPPK